MLCYRESIAKSLEIVQVADMEWEENWCCGEAGGTVSQV